MRLATIQQAISTVRWPCLTIIMLMLTTVTISWESRLTGKKQTGQYVNTWKGCYHKRYICVYRNAKMATLFVSLFLPFLSIKTLVTVHFLFTTWFAPFFCVLCNHVFLLSSIFIRFNGLSLVNSTINLIDQGFEYDQLWHVLQGELNFSQISIVSLLLISLLLRLLFQSTVVKLIVGTHLITWR